MADPAPAVGPDGRTAAFFDLDRTLLAGASGPVISEALRDAGLLPERNNPLESLLFRLFDLVGENAPTMWLTRQGARLVRGWDRLAVLAAAEVAAPILERLIQPYARTLLDAHREQGHLLVLATTTPEDFIRPFARRAGFDDVIATRYLHAEERYGGSIDGEFVWGRGKARSVEAYADRHDIDLASSFAYSDSYYDVPLLSIVGHPHVVNPDPRLRALATVRRWPAVWFDVPRGVPKFAGIEPQQVLMLLGRPELFPWVRMRFYGIERIPTTGPAILVANHRSYFDPLAIGLLLARRGRPVRFLGKKEVFDAPIVGDVARALGGIRVDRGTGSEEPLQAAEEALAAGEMVALMPQGTIPRGRAFYDPVLRGRWGAARLARATGAPVVPIGLWGTEKVWPRAERFPRVANLLHPPTVTLRVGAPVALSHDDLDEDTEAIMSAIMALLPPEARRPREPSAEEVDLATPPGAVPTEAAHEAARRPGRD